MEIIHVQHPILKSLVETAQPCVMALGFFDGVHIGHQQLIETARQIASQKKLKLAVMTFYPHPSQVVKNGKTIAKFVTPLSCKAQRLKEFGVEQMIIVEFNEEFARLSPSDFISQYIVGLNCEQVVVGFDFHYGYKGEGDIKSLKTEGRDRFKVNVINKYIINNLKVSSTLIRTLISEGDLSKVATYLGKPYECEAKVVSKKQYSKKTFLEVSVRDDYMIPPPGLYEVSIKIGYESFIGYAYLPSTESDYKRIAIQVNDTIMSSVVKKMVIIWENEIQLYNNSSQDFEKILII